MSGEGADRAATLESLKSVLALHNAIEENLVYPAIAKVAGEQGQAMQLFHETAEADILVYSLARAAYEENARVFVDVIEKLTPAILHHIEEEETRAFPLLKSAPHAELQLLAQQITAFKPSLIR